MRFNRFSGLLPDLIAAVVVWVLGDLLDWWNWPDLPLDGAILIVLVMIWMRSAVR